MSHHLTGTNLPLRLELEWHHHPLLWLKLLLPYYLWLLSLHISSLCSVFTHYPLISGSRISTHYHHLKLILSPFTYSFYLFIHSFTFTYNLPTTITDPSRLAFSRWSLVPLGRRLISISRCYMPVRELGSTSLSVIPVTSLSFPSRLCHSCHLSITTVSLSYVPFIIVYHCLSVFRLSSFSSLQIYSAPVMFRASFLGFVAALSYFNIFTFLWLDNKFIVFVILWLNYLVVLRHFT